MPAAGVVMLVAVVLIVLALVYYLVSTILVLRRIAAGLDAAIAGVGEIVEKSAPVNEIVTDINGQLDAGVALLEGLLVKKAGLSDAMGLIESVYPGAAAAGLRDVPGEHRGRATADRRGLHPGHADPRAARARGADRRRQPGGRGLAQHRGRQPRGPAAVPGRAPGAAREPAALAGDRHRRPGPVRAARGHRRPAEAAPDPARLSEDDADPGAIRVRACDQRRRRDRGSAARAAPRRGSSPAATACCR